MNRHIQRLQRRGRWLRTAGQFARLVVLVCLLVTLWVVIDIGWQVVRSYDPGSLSPNMGIAAITYPSPTDAILYHFLLYPLLALLVFVPFFASAEYLIWAGNQATSSAYELRLLYMLHNPNDSKKHGVTVAPDGPDEQREVWRPIGMRRGIPPGRNGSF